MTVAVVITSNQNPLAHCQRHVLGLLATARQKVRTLITPQPQFRPVRRLSDVIVVQVRLRAKKEWKHEDSNITSILKKNVFTGEITFDDFKTSMPLIEDCLKGQTLHSCEFHHFYVRIFHPPGDNKTVSIAMSFVNDKTVNDAEMVEEIVNKCIQHFRSFGFKHSSYAGEIHFPSKIYKLGESKSPTNFKEVWQKLLNEGSLGGFYQMLAVSVVLNSGLFTLKRVMDDVGTMVSLFVAVLSLLALIIKFIVDIRRRPKFKFEVQI